MNEIWFEKNAIYVTLDWYALQLVITTELALRIVSIKKTFKNRDTYTKKEPILKENVIEMKYIPLSRT